MGHGDGHFPDRRPALGIALLFFLPFVPGSVPLLGVRDEVGAEEQLEHNETEPYSQCAEEYSGRLDHILE